MHVSLCAPRKEIPDTRVSMIQVRSPRFFARGFAFSNFRPNSRAFLQMLHAALNRREGNAIVAALFFTLGAALAIIQHKETSHPSHHITFSTNRVHDEYARPHGQQPPLRHTFEDLRGILPDGHEARGAQSAHLTVVAGGRVFSPLELGEADLILFGSKVASIVKPPLPVSEYRRIFSWFPNSTIIDARNKTVTPGLVDVHVHVVGGGGERGPRSRTPEAVLSEFAQAGVTTFVGVLGTDEVSRSAEQLLMKIKGLVADGLSGYSWMGGYRVPVDTLTGSVKRDIMLIEEIIGVGELAISDHRGSFPTYADLSKIASDARVGGLLADKAGVLCAHVGALPSKLRPLWELVRDGFPITNLYPTHVSNRGAELLADAKEWMKAGGTIDFTADIPGETETLSSLKECRTEKLPLDRITLSSDGFGSAPRYDPNGRLVSYDVGKLDAVMRTLNMLVSPEYGWTIPEALSLSTANPARFLKLSGKGDIAVGFDADLLVFNRGARGPMELSELQYVWSKGELLKDGKWVKKGMFEN